MRGPSVRGEIPAVITVGSLRGAIHVVVAKVCGLTVGVGRRGQQTRVEMVVEAAALTGRVGNLRFIATLAFSREEHSSRRPGKQRLLPLPSQLLKREVEVCQGGVERNTRQPEVPDRLADDLFPNQRRHHDF